jgi:cutinase
VPQIRKKIPDIAVEGVTYGAGIAGNLTPEGGDPAGIADAKRLYNLAATKCPDTIITGGGYSQGAAITHRAVESLPDSVKQRIAGILLYGDTKHKQDGGQIKNFPKDKVRTFCNGYDDLKSASPDGVCGGALNVNAGHLSYGSTFGTAAEWLSQKVAAFKKSG